jgi:hypothetical protein
MLALELAELSEAGYDLALTGFDDIEIEAARRCRVAGDEDEHEQMSDEPDAADDVPDAPVVPVSRPAMSGSSARTA